MTMKKEGESLLNFPEKFPIKIFGYNNNEFRNSIKGIINKQVLESHQLIWTEGKSSNDKYVSITVKILAQNQEQLDNIYQDLTNNPLVKMAL